MTAVSILGATEKANTLLVTDEPHKQSRLSPRPLPNQPSPTAKSAMSRDIQCCCSETASESSSSCSDDEVEEDNDYDDAICLVQQRPKRKQSVLLLAADGPCLNFASELDAARNNASSSHQTTTLELHNFIERSTRHDVEAVQDLLWQQQQQQPPDHHHGITSVKLVDRAYASNFRRWAYKLDNVSHHIEKVCARRGIALDCQVHLELNVDDTPLESVVVLLQEIQKHPEVRHLSVVGHVNNSQAQQVLEAVTSLIHLQDREWLSVQVYTGYSGEDADYEAWRTTMEDYMNVFSQLYTKFNVPIDIRPCAVH